MFLLMAVATLVSVTQLAVIGSWGRSLRISTLWQGVITGFVVCGFLTVTVQFAWTRLAALITSASVYEIQSLASWTADPVIEEIGKVAPILVLAWLRPKIHRQLGFTDHLLYGAALGAGFAFLEAALRFSQLGWLAMDDPIDGAYLVDGNIGGTITVPTIWTSLFSWQPAPAATQDWFSSGGDSILHLAWSALAALGIAWLTRHRTPLRLLGLAPLAFVSLDHANYNYRISHTPGLVSDVISWMGQQLPWVLVVALLGAVAVDRLVLASALRAQPQLRLPGTAPGSSEGLGGLATGGGLWSAASVWQFVLSRRAAGYALAAAAPPPSLMTELAPMAAHLSAIRALPRPIAGQVWRAAGKDALSRIKPAGALTWQTVLWLVLLLPACVFLVIGGYPRLSFIQEAVAGPVGLWIAAGCVLGMGVLTAIQLPALFTAIRQVPDPSLHERRLRLSARAWLGCVSMAAGVVLVLRVILGGRAEGGVLPTMHVLDALSTAALILGLFLILASFVWFPPAALMVLSTGGAVLVPTAVAGSWAITVLAGGVLASAGIYAMNASGSGPGGRGGSHGGTPGNNQAQNKQFRDAQKAAERRTGHRFTKDEIRRVHDEISGQGYTFDEIVEEFIYIAGGG